MKKTYIEPKNTVVKLHLERMIADSAENPQVNSETNAKTVEEGGYFRLDEMQSRETVSAPDAWDEW